MSPVIFDESRWYLVNIPGISATQELETELSDERMRNEAQRPAVPGRGLEAISSHIAESLFLADEEPRRVR